MSGSRTFDMEHEDLRPISTAEFRASLYILLAAASTYIGIMVVALR